MTKKKNLQKPKPQSKLYYDYHECRDYLQAKYGYDERDYAGKFKSKVSNDSVPYQDFWHWLCDNYNVSNGCLIEFSRNFLEDDQIESWVREIYTHYIEEFADENGDLLLHCWW